MYKAQKPKKSETQTLEPLTFFYPHSKPETERDWASKPYYQVTSIDPAIDNYAIRVERWYKDEKQIIPLFFDKISLPKEEGFEKCCVNLSNYLDKYLNLFIESNYIICEKQMAINYNSTRISQHTISYFMLRLKDNELLTSIIELCPKLRLNMLGAPKGMNYFERKKWVTEKCFEILQERGDEISLLILNDCKKKDDLADTVCQVKGLFIYFKIDFDKITKDENFMNEMRPLYNGEIPILKVKKQRKTTQRKKVEKELPSDEVDENGILKRLKK